MIRQIINKMTLKEKIALCSGKNFWETKEYPAYGIPSMFMCDGPHGLRKQENAADMLGVNKSRKSTCFPTAVTTAGSWDVELIRQLGQAIAEEAENQKVGMVLGPGANIKRNPLCGRNFEYFSEDPYLAGEMAAAFIKGVERKGVSACLKHFAGNSQEKDRFVSDSIMDERTLREIYLSAFEKAVKDGKPSALMCAYPKLNGIHCSDHKELLTDILRKEWGFNGAVVTDWGAMYDRREGFKAGCDLNMPGGSAYMEKDVVKAVEAGELSEQDINVCAERVLRLVFKGVKAMTGENCDYDAHHDMCMKAAASGAVLLKNDEQLLPLKNGSEIALIGHMAQEMRYQGAGSSHINPTRLSQPIDSFKGCTFAEGCDANGDSNENLLNEVRKAASQADAVVVFAGLPDRYESEGFDRENMKMPEGQVKMIEAAASSNPNTIVVLFSGSPVECQWADRVKSILYLGLPGQAGGEAVRKLIYGQMVPSGKLAESWPFVYEDVPSAEIYGKGRDALYEEGIYVGYRYYDKAGVNVRWPFGYGLSYSKFQYSDLLVSGDELSVTVSNIGEYDAAEVVQMYVHAPQNGIHRPVRELKGFKKVFLKKGQSQRVHFLLDDRSFSIYQDGWKVPEGCYEINIGGLKAIIEKAGESVDIPDWQKNSFYENCKGKTDKEQWQQMLGRKYLSPPEKKKGQYDMESTIEEMRKHSLVMKLMYKAIELVFVKSCGKKDYNDPEFKMLMTSSVGGPLRSMYISSGMKGGVFPGLLEMANGHFIKGIIRMIKG